MLRLFILIAPRNRCVDDVLQLLNAYPKIHVYLKGSQEHKRADLPDDYTIIKAWKTRG